MFSRISGTLRERSAESALVEAGGLGYEIIMPPSVAAKLPATPGASVALEIYAQLQIDGNSGRFTYFGFSNAIEREFFEALISVASIGPKSAARGSTRRAARRWAAGRRRISGSTPGSAMSSATSSPAR